MFMSDNKKKGPATLIVAAMKKKPEMREAPAQDGADMDADHFEIAADEIIEALEKKDKRAFADALKSFVTMCDDDSEYEEKEEPQAADEE